MNILIGILEEGLGYSYLAVGLYFAYQILSFADLTVDGSFPLGAAITAAALVSGLSPLTAMGLSLIAGSLAGLATGFIHVKMGVKDLLAGLIMQTALYTVNLTVAGRANLPFYKQNTVFSNPLIDGIIPDFLVPYKNIIILLIICLLMKFLLDEFLKSRLGFLIRATGDNPGLVSTFAKDPGMVKILGLSISNALVAFSGSLVAQQQRFFEISMGMGSMVMGLASLVLGLKVLGPIRGMKGTGKVIFGSIIYKGVIALAIQLGLSANSLKLMTALIFLIILVLGRREDAYPKKHIHGFSKGDS